MGLAKRWLRYLGIFLLVLVFIIVIEMLLEYWQIRSGFSKMAGKSVIIEEFTFKEGGGGEKQPDGKIIRAIYLGKKKTECKKDSGAQNCFTRLKFLSIDANGNPLVYWIYGGGEQNQIGVYLQEEGEAGSPIAWVNSNKLIDQLNLDKDKEVGLVVLDRKVDSLFDDKLTSAIELIEEQGDILRDFFVNIEVKEANQLVGFWNSLFGYRKMTLPVVFIDFSL
jgi:hypothetical protein